VSERQPVVSVVVPMLDEAGFIDACLDSFAAQTHPLDRLEVLVVDGGSTDGSREVVEARARYEPWIRIVENPDRRASSAFNRGVEAATGEVLCLFSAHGVADPAYVARSVAALRATGAAGVGGRYDHVGLDPTSSAIGLAMVSPFGMASPHRFATESRDVDTISHPAYRRAAMLEVGPFDETLLRNSDYEFNHRMLEHGHRLVFEPSVRSVYRPRGSLKALGRQFWWYGRWKARVLARHPGSLKARHLVPPGAVAAGVALVAASPTRAGRRALAVAAVAYGVGVAAAVAHARPARHHASPVVLAATFPIMHASWGAGFLTSLVEDRVRPRAR
jgi:succinoglycan biosynthesis protein ExoA